MADHADLDDTEIFQRGQRRVLLGAAFVALSAAAELVPPLLMLGMTIFIAVDAPPAGVSGAAGTQLAVAVILSVICLVAMALPVLLVGLAAVAWRMRSSQTILLTGIASIVLACVYTAMSCCSAGGLGCLVFPVILGFGVTGGVLLIVASQDPTVEAAVRARQAWIRGDAADHEASGL